MPHLETFVALQPFHLKRSFALQTVGHFDPTARLDDDCFRKIFAHPDGISLLQITPQPGGLHLSLHSPAAEPLLAELVASFARDDGYSTFTPAHPLLGKQHREQPGLRLIRVPWLFDIACSAVLQQRVRFVDACRDWRHVAMRFGTGTAAAFEGAAAFPDPATLAAIPLHALEALGIDSKRARTLLALAREWKLYPLRSNHTFTQLRGRLARVPGIGPWTVETILGFGAADPDALPLGDLYLPHLVGHALAGENPCTDERMVQLLEPFRPHRFRVARLLYGAEISVPKTQQVIPAKPSCGNPPGLKQANLEQLSLPARTSVRVRHHT